MKTAYTHCALFDGEKESCLQENRTILVNGHKIERILSSEEPFPSDYTEKNCTGLYVIPGLINMHMHLFGSGKPSKALAGGGNQKLILNLVKKWPGSMILDAMVADHLKAALSSGVTTARAVGDFYYSDVKARDRINQGKLTGPRLLVSGPALTVPGGHGDGTFALTASDKAGFEALVKQNAEHRVDFIKICVTGGVMDAKKKGEPGELRMNLEQTKAVCDAAHAYGYMVASHTESMPGVKVALAGGVDTIEHGSEIDIETLQLYKDHNSALICTISPAYPLAKLDSSLTMLPEMAQYNSEVVLRGIVEGSKTAMKENIPVGLGTDASCPFVAPYDMWRELWYFVKETGVSNAYAIHTATLANAKILKLDTVTGSILAGKDADLLFVQENPLIDLKALREPKMVVHRGTCIEQPIVKKNELLERNLNQLMEK